MKKPAVKKTVKKLAVKAMNESSLITQTRKLAWTSQHAQAIDLTSQALSTSKIKPAWQMDLLDLRAESYIAQGKLDLASKNTAAIIKLANMERKPH